MEENLYTYKAIISSVYDGDTCTADIDLGFKFYHKGIKLRLKDIDTPELRGETLEEARRSRDYLRELVLDKEVIITTERDSTGKYGRYIATLWIKNENEDYINVNTLMVESGFAAEKIY